MSKENLDISIVVPLYNEEESLPELLAWIDRVCTGNSFSYEAILIITTNSIAVFFKYFDHFFFIMFFVTIMLHIGQLV